MDRQSRTFWILRASAFSLILLAILLVLMIWLAGGAGINMTFAASLRSRLGADYSVDDLTRTLRSIRLAIFGETLADRGLEFGAAEDLNALLLNPVPTVTPMGGVALTPSPNPSEGEGGTATAQAAQSTETAVAGYTQEAEATLTAQAQLTVAAELTQAASPTASKSPVWTETPEKTPLGSCDGDLCPALLCVDHVGANTYMAYYDYTNTTDDYLQVPIGPDNYFKPEPKNRGQGWMFAPDHQAGSSYPAFAVEFDGSALTWHLRGKRAKASSASPACDGSVDTSATGTPVPTLTPEPTSTTKASRTPTRTPSPTPTVADEAAPNVEGGTLEPPAGELEVCSKTITVTDLYVTDPAPSSGIEWVKLKYNVEGYSDWIYSDPMFLCSGGWTENGGWAGCYEGTILIEIDLSWESPESGDYGIHLHAKARDHAGNSGHEFLGTYTMPASCGQSSSDSDDEGDD